MCLESVTHVAVQAAQALLDNPAVVMEGKRLGEGEGVREGGGRLALHGRLVTLRSYLVHWLNI